MDVLLKKQKITIKTSDERLGFQLRQITNGSLKDELQLMMEGVFSKRSLSSTNLYIDRLFLDLGTLSPKAFQKEFVALTEAKLIETLNGLFQGDKMHTHNDPLIKGTGSIYDPSRDNPPLTSYKLRSQRQKERDALLYFLENGIFPWWFRQETRQQEPPDLLGKILDGQSEEFVLQLISFKKTKSDQNFKNIVTRLFIYSKGSLYKPIIATLTRLLNNQRLSDDVELIIKNIDQIKKALFTKDPISTKDLHQFLFTEILLHDYERPEGFLYHFLKQLVQMAKAAPTTTTTTTTKDYPLKTVSLSEAELKAAFLKIFQEDEKQSDRFGEKGNLGADDPSNSPISERPLPEDDPIAALKSFGKEKITESIYIDNAGLLLLHPFLPTLFAQSGLLIKNEQFASNEDQQKAAVLLFYLQSGDVQYKEWEMTLNKLLCGLDHQDILEQNLPISDKDRENCDQLLEAVIEHWKALKGASIPALRQTFILRDGKLSQKEEHWLVQVERTGVDVLLDRLPWGYGVIKLPWLKNIVFTEW